jgi:hypothetical protein
MTGSRQTNQHSLDRKNFKPQFLWLRVRENYQPALLIGHDIKMNGRLIFRAGRPQIIAHCGFRATTAHDEIAKFCPIADAVRQFTT